ncbi:Serine/threonine-protein phosphatase 2A 65 kDa regulatory subunit A gamma isoform [Hondaea fermentalgiana]|uniref:Serine/threonine-protein phosphatase 2A 65 kDa regulatory subunit A gamma isoform n=1 Tax=Hondaea fermentalgiana TaxID=2315210 RepID=A0A2R5G6T6_9STRA|nr:Serine/threonine-protein phosphatase 2A 65 kDa regulatory subunit A gamma isoform [Hondaea fermentalgiana]|eukprot:GBG26029.1 Serine/threonine-protein phosphatase 2A 65 kDa regulatory subunit A gamma isoform [Hondaea fermentalgiana]
MADLESRDQVMTFWSSEISSFLDDETRAHAVGHSHLIAREVGAKRVVDAMDKILLPRETSDLVWCALAKSLGAREFSESARAKCLLHWLLEMPEPQVRREAVRSVLLHAHRGDPLVAYPGALDVSIFDSIPSVDGKSSPNAAPVSPSNGTASSPRGSPKKTQSGSNYQSNEKTNNNNNNIAGKHGSPVSSSSAASRRDRIPSNGSEDNRIAPGCLLLPHLCEPGSFKSFFQRISVCELLAEPIPSGLSPEEEVDLIHKLGKDPVPMVRAAVAKNLGSLAHKAAVKAARNPKKSAMSSPKASRPEIKKKKKNSEDASAVVSPSPLGLSSRSSSSDRGDIAVPETLLQRKMPLSLVRDLMADPDDLVQALAIEHCLAQFILEMRTPDEKVHFLHVLKESLVHSNSWRSRFALASQLDFLFDELAKWNPSASSHVIHGDDDAEDLPDAVAKVDLDGALGSDLPQAVALNTSNSSGRARGASRGRSSSSGGDSGSGISNGMEDVEKVPQSFRLEDLQFIVMELFSDPMPEVRSAAAKHFKFFFANPVFTPLLEKLVGDEDAAVRRAILETFPSLARRAPSQIANMLHHLISDDPEPDIRISAVQIFFRADFLRLLPKGLCLDLLPQVYGAVFWAGENAGMRSASVQSSHDPNAAASTWRAKDAAIAAVHEVVKVLSESEWTHQANGVNFLIQCLRSPVRRIRSNAVSQIPAIAERFGHDWMQHHLVGIPQVLMQDPASDYKVRITALELVEQLVKVQCSSGQLEQVVRAAAQSDPVKNVRQKAQGLLQL